MKRDPATRAPDLYRFARDYLHSYLPTVARRSPNTVEAYRIGLECFLHYLADDQHVDRAHVSFDHFDRQHLKGWLAWMADQQHYAPKTIALRLTTIKSFLTYCSAEDITLVALSQAANTLRAPTSARKPIEYLTEPETRAVLAAFTGRTAKSRRNRMLLILLYDTAARVGEITTLTLQDLRLSNPDMLCSPARDTGPASSRSPARRSSTWRSTSPSSTRTGADSPRRGRCSTACTTAGRPGSRPTPSRPCSTVPL
jgi:site-specific recombinase XerD